MKISDKNNDILKHTEYYLDKIETALEAGPAIKKIQSEKPSDNVFRYYNRLYILSTIIIDHLLKNDLQNLIDKTYKISKDDYSINDQIEWLEKLASTVASSSNILISQLCNKIQNHTKREVAFIQLNSDNQEMIDKIKLIQGAINNHAGLNTPPTLQQIYINVLVDETLNFRLSTLSTDQAWDFIAQTILEETKTKP